MARPRHLLLCVGVILCLSACDRAPTAGAQKPRAKAPAATKIAPRPAPERVVVAPQWQSRVPAITAAEVAPTLRQAGAALARGQVEQGTSPGPGALELYLAVLAVAPDEPRAQAGVRAALDALLERGRLAMRAGAIDEAQRVETIADSLLPGHTDLPLYRKQLGRARLAQRSLGLAEQAAAGGDITLPTGRSALDHLSVARRAFPDLEPLAAAQRRWNAVLLQRARDAAAKEDFAAADSWLLESTRLAPASVEARVQRLRIIELRQARTEALLAAGNADVEALRLPEADAALAHAARVAAQPGGVAALRARIHLARHYGPFQPGQVFAEKLAGGGAAPEMVVIPYGRFRMGASEADPRHQDNELPAHEVEFRRGFAIARNETTVAEFGRFVAATGFRTAATRAGHSQVYDEKGGVFGEHEGVDWRRDHVGRIASPALPVVHITLPDALAYARWLSRQTGQRYRLPSEAEFEYVLRAGKNGSFPWGEGSPKRIVGNLPGDGDLSTVGRHWGNAIPDYRDAFWGPAPVRNFAVEPFGTYDLIGNVSEWTFDCWHDSYLRAPLNGSAWVNPGCPVRTVRGASWGSSLDQARSASRLPMDPAASTARLGFRVLREL